MPKCARLIQIEFPDDIGKQLDSMMPNWNVLQNRITHSHLYKDQTLALSHASTKQKLEFAMFHMAVMSHAYNKQYPSTETPEFLIRASFEAIILSLASGLDSLAHEINRFYLFGRDFKFVQMDHQSAHRECIRCDLDKIDDDLSRLLNGELPSITKDKRQQFAEHWYLSFSDYRNHIVHRTLSVLGYTPEGILLPDDPAQIDPKVTKIYDHQTHKLLMQPDYSNLRDPKDYSLNCLGKVTKIVENSYFHLIEKV